MKKIIIILTATFVLVACEEKTAQTNSANNPADTAAYNNNNYADSGYNTQSAPSYPNTYYHSPSSRPVYHHRASYVSRSSYSAHTTVVRKKGWSSGAKGAVIGAGSGAVLGAVVSGDHHRVAGAVIGATVGAAGGYLYGHHRDKKRRRYY